MADTSGMLRYGARVVEPPDETTGDEDLSFAVFSLTHAECGDDVLEVRIGERILLEWCMACAAMQVFGPYER